MITNPNLKRVGRFPIADRRGRPRQLRGTVIAAVVLIAFTALGATAAHAATGDGPYSVIGAGSNGLNERGAPSTSAALVGRVPNGATVYIACQTSGTPYSTGGSPASDRIWDQLTNGTYVADYWLSTPAVGTFSAGIPRCGSGTSSQPVAKLLNRQSARCLDADANTIGIPGTRVQLWDCLTTQNNQNWSFYADGTIRNAQSGQCLDADLNTVAANGTIVHLWTCNGGANQQWTIGADSTIRSRYSGRCLDADMGTIGTSGTKVQLWNCNGGQNQDWTRFAPNNPVPSVCRTYTIIYRSPTLFTLSTLPVSFGLGAGFCYNGSSVHLAPETVKPVCVNPNPGGDCSRTSEAAFGSSVNDYFHVSFAGFLPGHIGAFEEWYNPTASISVTPNGKATMHADPGPATWGP